jgi:hypothetical protein
MNETSLSAGCCQRHSHSNITNDVAENACTSSAIVRLSSGLSRMSRSMSIAENVPFLHKAV